MPPPPETNQDLACFSLCYYAKFLVAHGLQIPKSVRILAEVLHQFEKMQRFFRLPSAYSACGEHNQ
jgi:hypothetical protein